MNFTSPEFLCFFPVICIGYALLPKKKVWMWLLAASFFFYLCHSPWTVLLLVSAIGVSYCGALKIARTEESKKRKRIMWSVVVFCLGALIFFKYWHFHPIGISFYTFQTLSYVIDVYRGDIEAEENPGYYALFISFFPQLVAGPIERPGNLLPQLKAIEGPKMSDLTYGIGRMAQGYFKKLVVADFLAIFVDRVYGTPRQANGLAVLTGTIFFAFQIYCDFSGYSDIACGAARIFGIRLMENFDSPYLAKSPRQFWRKWHISLTGWLTDYIYKSLGGSRRGSIRQCINIMLVFLCSGLWHGGTWNFCIWGLCHGAFVTAETLLENKNSRTGKHSHQRYGKIQAALRQTGFFLLICFPWIFFRAGNPEDAFCMIKNLAAGWSVEGIRQAGALLQIKITDVVQILLGLSCVKVMNEKKELLGRGRNVWGLYFLLTGVLLAWLFLLSSNRESAFIYFQF